MATSKYPCIEDAEIQAPLLKPWDYREGKHNTTVFRCNLGQKMMQSSVVAAMSMVCKRVGSVVMKDTTKTIHALKMALALLLVFLLVLLRAPYEQFGEHAIWAIMTVIVVFEFTIGATLSKGLNRGVGTLLAALLAIGIGELAECMSGGVGYPIVIGFFVFLVGGVVTFGMVWPSFKSYEYGFRTFLLTFSLIIVAEYRGDDPFSTAVNRFVVILLGAVIGISVNVFLLPCWAGHDLHLSIIANFHGVADSLEGLFTYLQAFTCMSHFAFDAGEVLHTPIEYNYTIGMGLGFMDSISSFVINKEKVQRPPMAAYITIVERHSW